MNQIYMHAQTVYIRLDLCWKRNRKGIQMNCHVNKLPCQILCITQRISKYKKMGRSNKFENTLIDEKAMNDFILLRTELMPITSFYPTY